MKNRCLVVLALGMITIMVSSQTHATLLDRGAGLIYDTDLNVTWMQDANYAKTSGYDNDGMMNWQTAQNWASNLIYHDINTGISYDDWRLPTTIPEVEGYNQTTSELGHLYYIELGNAAGYSPKNWFPFINFQSSVYWSSTTTLINTNQGLFPGVFSFITTDGEQDITDPVVFERYSLVVRDGDVAAAPVPEPTTMLLIGTGLFGLLVVVRRKKKK